MKKISQSAIKNGQDQSNANRLEMLPTPRLPFNCNPCCVRSSHCCSWFDFFFVVMLQVFPMNIGQTHVLDGQFHVWQVNPIDFIICNKSTIWTKNWLKVNPFSCFNIPTFRWSKHIQTPMYHVWISRIGQIRRFQHSPTWMALIQHLFFGITKIYYPVVI